jgi:hypothetical protein
MHCATAFAATPFASCPSQAFIVQSPSATAMLYGVDLASGSYSTLSPEMGTSKVTVICRIYSGNAVLTCMFPDYSRIGKVTHVVDLCD